MNLYERVKDIVDEKGVGIKCFQIDWEEENENGVLIEYNAMIHCGKQNPNLHLKSVFDNEKFEYNMYAENIMPFGIVWLDNGGWIRIAPSWDYYNDCEYLEVEYLILPEIPSYLL